MYLNFNTVQKIRLMSEIFCRNLNSLKLQISTFQSNNMKNLRAMNFILNYFLIMMQFTIELF